MSRRFNCLHSQRTRSCSEYGLIIQTNYLTSLRFNKNVVSRAPSLDNYRVFSCYPPTNRQNFFMLFCYRLYNTIVFYSLSIVFYIFVKLFGDDINAVFHCCHMLHLAAAILIPSLNEISNIGRRKKFK